MKQKIELGQFFTKANIWLKPQVINFISDVKNSHCLNTIFDPFVGDGDLLNAVNEKVFFDNKIGFDIDKNLIQKLHWKYNNSLINIPHFDNTILVTNPPYIAKQSATRKGLNLQQYFQNSIYDDVYLIALDNCLKAQDFIVAIIPESFINSNYLQKHRLHSITILEENPFVDTENPVCVACFDDKIKNLDSIKIYKNDIYIDNLHNIFNLKLSPSNNIEINFNNLNGWLGLRAIDSSNDENFISFDFKENIIYDWEKNIKETSRHFSLINIKIPFTDRKNFIIECNNILNNLRKKSADVVLTPFKGNTKKGVRRRRLDFKLARAIMENAYNKIYNTNLI